MNNIIIWSIYIPNSKVSKYMKQRHNWDEDNQIYKHTVLNIISDREDLSSTCRELDLIDISRRLCPTTAECALFPNVHWPLTMLDHILGHKMNLTNPKESMFSDQNSEVWSCSAEMFQALMVHICDGGLVRWYPLECLHNETSPNNHGSQHSPIIKWHLTINQKSITERDL